MGKTPSADGRGVIPVIDVVRYEILPFAKAEDQASRIAEPLRLTVTASTNQGIERSLDVALRLRRLGHDVTLHVAARMMRGESHLHEIIVRARDAGIDDFFVIGGDRPEPLGPFSAAGDLLDAIVRHPLRPRRIGIGAYPEGHPLIPNTVIEAALAQKSMVADYIVTQLCFDAGALLVWLDDVRGRGIDLPVYVGAVGPIERRRLLEISLRVGVGPSLRFVAKHNGLAQLFRSPLDSASRFLDGVAPLVGDPRRRIAGFHFYTFNELIATRSWYEERQRLHSRPLRFGG